MRATDIALLAIFTRGSSELFGIVPAIAAAAATTAAAAASVAFSLRSVESCFGCFRGCFSKGAVSNTCDTSGRLRGVLFR